MILMAGCTVLLSACHGGPDKALGEGQQYHVGPGYPRSFGLPDGSTILVMQGSSISMAKGFGKTNRDMDVDGEVAIEVKPAMGVGSGGGASSGVVWPFVVHTRDLVIEVLPGAARLHVDAVRSRPGEEVDLLDGALRVRKSYHSDTDNEPEVLAAGEMVMVNRDIDLMEKEKLSTVELEKLKEKVRN
jgi:transmembrane sensor